MAYKKDYETAFKPCPNLIELEENAKNNSFIITLVSHKIKSEP